MSEREQSSGVVRWPAGLAASLALLAVASCAGPGAVTPHAEATADGTAEQQASFAAYAVAAQRALEYLPDHASARWTDPADGRELHLTVLATEIADSGLVCRNVQLTADRGETIQRFCRDDSASWRFAGAETD